MTVGALRAAPIRLPDDAPGNDSIREPAEWMDDAPGSARFALWARGRDSGMPAATARTTPVAALWMPYGPERDTQATVREDAGSSGRMRFNPNILVGNDVGKSNFPG